MTLTTEEQDDANGPTLTETAVASKDDDTDDVEDVVSPGCLFRANLVLSASSGRLNPDERSEN